MRNFILVLVLIISSDTYSQIGKSQIYDKPTEVGKVERLLGDTYSLYTLSFTEMEQGKTIYVLTFTNENTLYDNDNVTDIRALGFMATQNEFDYFYNFLRQGFKEDQMKSLEVGQDVVKTLTPRSRFLYISVDFKDGTSAMLKLTKRQLAKLFGKK